MKYSRFEELPAWQAAIELAIRIYNLTSRPAFKTRYSLKIKSSEQLSQFRITLLKALNAGQRKSSSLFCILGEAHVGKCGRCSACWSVYLSLMI